MAGYQTIRDLLRSSPGMFSHLDAAQLVKHALGLRSAVQHGREYQGKRPVLVYLYSEPLTWPDGRLIDRNLRTRHRMEVDQFASAVVGCEVEFCALSYSALLDTWSRSDSELVRAHARAIRAHFRF